MKSYELSHEARDDLQEIWVYVANHSLNAADELEAAIYHACQDLANNPDLGHKRTDLTDEPVSFHLVRSHYLVIYHKSKGPLKIVRILHAARDVSQIL